MEYLKYISGIILLTAVMIGCNSKKSNNEKEGLSTDVINNPASASEDGEGKMPDIEFKTKTHDFKDVYEGEKVSYGFKFTNTGEADLIIANVVPSCGCTVPTFPEHPIKPGDVGYIKVVFDSKGRSGKFSKSVNVFANTIPNTVQLFIKGSIIKK